MHLVHLWYCLLLSRNGICFLACVDVLFSFVYKISLSIVEQTIANVREKRKKKDKTIAKWWNIRSILSTDEPNYKREPFRMQNEINFRQRQQSKKHNQLHKIQWRAQTRQTEQMCSKSDKQCRQAWHAFHSERCSRNYLFDRSLVSKVHNMIWQHALKMQNFD